MKSRDFKRTKDSAQSLITPCSIAFSEKEAGTRGGDPAVS